ncbi:hypothetical protein TNCV_5137551 [Trichonephila clavipes]|nr:hypothetical protein TNCV_5137551 [Trichonephila clavipes]
MLDRTNDMLDRSNDMLDRSNDMLDRSNDMLDRSNDMLDGLPEFEMETRLQILTVLTKIIWPFKSTPKVLAFYTLMRSRETISIGWSFQRCLETLNRLDWPRKIIQRK